MDVAVDSSSRREGRRFVRPIAIVAVVAGLVLIVLWPAIDAAWLPGMSCSKYNAVLHTAIAEANRVVIRDGGMDCCGPVDGQDVLYEITDIGQVREFREHLQTAMPVGATMSMLRLPGHRLVRRATASCDHCNNAHPVSAVGRLPWRCVSN